MLHLDKLFGRLGNRMFQLAYLYAKVLDGEIPNIYVQHPEYFERHSSAIKKLFGDDIGYTDRVVIHVRRDDYVGNPVYYNLFESDYYQKAMAMFPGETFLVFSDDIAWCQKQELFKNCEFWINKQPYEDINKMASCKGHIIANSSFSWWGAYLSPHKGKVVAPTQEHWYNKPTDITRTPKEWITI